MLVKKTDKYKLGICSVTEFIGHKKAEKFNKGEAIEIEKEIAGRLEKFGWVQEVKQKKGVKK